MSRCRFGRNSQLRPGVAGFFTTTGDLVAQAGEQLSGPDTEFPVPSCGYAGSIF